ncbi:hypothetical protein MNBD_GAMMA11-309 [hydrothermal vent metagenome]|uniref:Uncharacterized protein n=1 Tax=hydrothermal vent metagenome TaxID=652676 RepID=A0A3B0XK90_9ZZZZ
MSNLPNLPRQLTQTPTITIDIILPQARALPGHPGQTEVVSFANITQAIDLHDVILISQGGCPVMRFFHNHPLLLPLMLMWDSLLILSLV